MALADLAIRTQSHVGQRRGVEVNVSLATPGPPAFVCIPAVWRPPLREHSVNYFVRPLFAQNQACFAWLLCHGHSVVDAVALLCACPLARGEDVWVNHCTRHRILGHVGS